ncbi:MAG: hypothetical protein QW324_04775 [Thermofilaceae archaeon]
MWIRASAWLAPAIVFTVVVFAALIPATGEASTSQPTLVPSVEVLRLVRGTPGSSIPGVSYDVLFTLDEEGSIPWFFCEVIGYEAGASFGLSGEVSDYDCQVVYSETNEVLIFVYVYVLIRGQFQGGNGTLFALRSVTVRVVSEEGDEMTLYLAAAPILVEEVMVSVQLGSPPVIGQPEYGVIPPEPRVQTSIWIASSRTVHLSVVLSNSPSVPTELSVDVRFYTTIGISGSVTTVVSFAPGEVSKSVYVSGVPSGALCEAVVMHAGLPLSFAPFQVPEDSLTGVANLILYQPTLVFRDGYYSLLGGVNVHHVSGGSLRVCFYLDKPSRFRSSSCVYSIVEPGRYEIIIPLHVKRTSDLGKDPFQGYYEVVFTPAGGVGAVSFNVNYVALPPVSYGEFLRDIFLLLFIMTVSAGFGVFALGFVLRRFDLVSQAMMFLLLGVLIFVIPVIMGHAVRIATLAGVRDPIGLGNLDVTNLGEKIDNAINYVSSAGKAVGNFLTAAAGNVAVIIGVVLGVTAAAGVAGIFTAGALSQAVGGIASSLGAALVSILIVLAFAGVLMVTLSAIYPVIITLIVSVILFACLLHLVLSVITGNIGPVINSIVQFSMTIMFVLLTPIILATIEALKLDPPKIRIIDIAGLRVEISLGPIYDLVIGVIYAVIVAFVIGAALQQLLSVIRGFGHVG